MLIGLLWLLCAVLCFAGLKNVAENKKKPAIALIVFFGFFGFCGVLGGILQSMFLLSTAVLLSVAILCIAVFIYAIWNQNTCKTQISGVYQGFQVHKGRRGHRTYLPVFKYYYRGTEYVARAYEHYSLKKINARFVPGHSYPIWINENVPDAYITRKKLGGTVIVTFLVGLLMLFMYAITVLGVLVVRFAPTLKLNI